MVWPHLHPEVLGQVLADLRGRRVIAERLQGLQRPVAQPYRVFLLSSTSSAIGSSVNLDTGRCASVWPSHYHNRKGEQRGVLAGSHCFRVSLFIPCQPLFQGTQDRRWAQLLSD
jgi:hypothetical protein